MVIKIPDYSNDSMLDIYIFETTQLIEQLEQSMLSGEADEDSKYDIDEIFRIMHTIKGSSAMMHFDEVSTLAHTMEDMFYYIREKQLTDYNSSYLCDLVLESIDFIKGEMEKIKENQTSNGDAKEIISKINDMLQELKGDKPRLIEKDTAKEVSDLEDIILDSRYKYYYATVWFQEDCGLENIRAYSIIHNLKSITKFSLSIPSDVGENDETIHVIQRNGFKIFLKTDLSYDEMYDFFSKTALVKNFEIVRIKSITLNTFDGNKDISSSLTIKQEDIDINQERKSAQDKNIQDRKDTKDTKSSQHQSLVSVDIKKLDKLMDLVGEMVIAETMVTQNPDLKGLELDNFQKASRQLRKIDSELQDTVMSIRMLPLANTFFKMQRIVRDMNKKLEKNVELEIIGEDTEVDKNIIDHISDPLMHLIRNAVDHGIEACEERIQNGKSETGKVTLEAKNAGGEVLILVKDDGKGLEKEKILKRAKEHGLLTKNEHEMTEKEIFSLILIPGFSTNENVTEYSGRGVGMDVVAKGIESIGGNITIESMPNEGTTITLRIPLTLAIIDGMNIAVGESRYTLPISAIRESFKVSSNDLICDPDGDEMIMLRGECYPILRLHKQFMLESAKTSITDGIIIVVENEDKALCVFADELLGEQQVVVKTLPTYIRNAKKIKSLAGCTLLGDGNISLILDAAELTNIRNVNIKKHE